MGSGSAGLSLPGNGPDKAGQLTGDGGGHHGRRLASSGQPAITPAQPQLGLPSCVPDRGSQALLPKQQLAADPRRKAVAPSGFDQQAPGRPISGFGDPALASPLAAGLLRGNQPKVGHQMPRV